MDDYRVNELDYYPYAYDAGQFHHVYAGEVYSNRYRVCRKLGFGSSATVWLVKDIATNGYFAMKVLSAAVSGGEADLDELEVIEYLRAADPAHPGWEHTLRLFDHFYHPGSGGLHHCFVFPVMGESLVTYAQKWPHYCIPSHVLARIASQLLQVLDYAHSKGVIHTDIKQENIMIKMKDQTLIEDWYLPRTEGCMDPAPSVLQPYSEVSFLSRPNSDRLHPSQLPCLPLASYHFGRNPTLQDFENIEIVLVDWGLAAPTDPELRRTNDVVPIVLRAPELLLEAGWDEKVDIWAAGCVLFELAEDRRLFVGEGETADGWQYNPEYHLVEMTEILGDIPGSLLARANSDTREYCFDDAGKMRMQRFNTCSPLKDCVQRIEGAQKDDFLHVLKLMLALDPAMRLSAALLLQESWIKSASIVVPVASLETGADRDIGTERIEDGHEKIKLTMTTGESPADHEFNNHPIVEPGVSSGVATEAELPERKLEVVQMAASISDSSSNIDRVANGPALQPTSDESGRAKKPVRRGFRMFTKATPAEKALGALWLAKAAILRWTRLVR